MKTKIIIALILLAVPALLFAVMLHSGAIVLDRSGVHNGENELYWNGKHYIACGGQYEFEKRIAKTTDGLNINSIKGDPDRNFVVLSSFLDSYLLVDEGYDIPQSGKISSAYWNFTKVKDGEFLQFLAEAMQNAPDFRYETDESVAFKTESHCMGVVFVGYNNCPVSSVYVGYLGKIRGEWYLATDIPDDIYNADGTVKPHTVLCYTVPEKYTPLLEKLNIIS